MTTTFAHDRFDAYCDRYGPEFRAAALAAATLDGDTVNIPAAKLAELRQQFRLRPRPRPRGLGDVVAGVAQPIARAIDAVAGTDIEHCGGCQRRRELLNRIQL